MKNVTDAISAMVIMMLGLSCGLDIYFNVFSFLDQENAELLTQEGSLLQSMQGRELSECDIDRYANRLSEIINRKVCHEAGRRGSVSENLRS